MSNLAQVNIDKFISACTLTFKAFDYDVKMTRIESSFWNFLVNHSKTKKQYAVFCAPNLDESNAYIDMALTILPKNTRLVVITHSMSDAEKRKADELGHALVTLQDIKWYGNEVINAKEREEKEVNFRRKII